MTIAEVCRLSREVQTGELLEAIALDRALEPGTKEADREFVLRATYPTVPLRLLTTYVAEKLTGRSPKGAAVVRGDYGSGKSHALLALFHLALAGEGAAEWLRRWGVRAEFPADTRVALVQLVAEQPETFWEPLFARAGMADLADRVWKAPIREVWAELTAEGPVLLIVDELELWFGQNRDRAEDIQAGVQNLLEAANLPEVPLAVVLSVYGRDPALMGTINRSQPPIWDVGTAEDRHRILRHRLLERVDEAKVEQVVNAYLEAYQRVRSELPETGLRLADLHREFRETYPFHPAFLRQAFAVYASAPHHESTRGIIYLGATLLRRWASQRDALLAGDLEVTDEDIASDLCRLDPDLVANAREDLSQRCHGIAQAPGLLGTVLLHSFSPFGTPGATKEEVLLGNLRPETNVNDLRTDLAEVQQRAWFLDEIEERLLITKEVVLLKQIEQMARTKVETAEGTEEAAERVREVLRSLANGERLYLYPEEPLPPALSSPALKMAVSLEPMTETQAEEILRGLDNTVVLLAPKPAVRERLTHDRELLLRATRVLVCEELLRQRTRRKSEVQEYKQRFQQELKERIEESYGRWMRLSRVGELGQEPRFVVRAVDCGLAWESVKEAIRGQNDADTVREGLAKLLRCAGAQAPKGSDGAGRTIRELREDLRRYAGLPILVEEGQLEEALQGMVQDDSLLAGVVVAIGKAVYGHDDRPLPLPLGEDWRVWLKAYGPEPPAKEDVKHAVRQALASAQRGGVEWGVLRGDIASQLEVPPSEVAQALTELVRDGDAVVEQEESRYPDDDLLASETLRDGARAWLTDYAPPDDRRARERILALVGEAGEAGVSVGEVKAQLRLETLTEAALERALTRLLTQGKIAAYTPQEQMALHEPGLLTDESLLRLPIPLPPQPEPGWEPFQLPIGPYRLLNKLLEDLRARLQEGSRIRSAAFQVTPPEEEDPLFGWDEEASRVAQVRVQHQLDYTFHYPVSKEALMNLVERLVSRLGERGEVLLEARVEGEVPGGGA